MMEAPALLLCALLLAAAVALGARWAALSPRNTTFPPGPELLRVLMFVYALALVGMLALVMSEPTSISRIMLVAAFIHAAYHVGMAANLLRQNYPPKVWAALHKIQRLASCKRPDRVPMVVEAGVTGALRAEGAEFVAGPAETTAQVITRH